MGAKIKRKPRKILTERGTWGNKNIPKAGPPVWMPHKGYIIDVYDGDKLKKQLESLGFEYVGRRIWEREVKPKDFKKFFDELDRLGVYTATARKMHVYKPGLR